MVGVVPVAVSFSNVSTHNHFVFDAGGKVFNGHAPVIKLKPPVEEATFFSILGVLNSSVACFWMKQVFSCKGLGGQGGGIKPEEWHRAFEFDGTKLESFPLPPKWRQCEDLARRLHSLALAIRNTSPVSVLTQGSHDLRGRLAKARIETGILYRQMVALQEEVDWLAYHIFGVAEYHSISPQDLEVGLHPADRPAEKLHRKQMKEGQGSIFYEVHTFRGAEGAGELNSGMRRAVEERLETISHNPSLQLIETVNFKRRWQVTPWETQVQEACENWFLKRLETYFDLDGRMNDKSKPTVEIEIGSGELKFLATWVLRKLKRS